MLDHEAMSLVRDRYEKFNGVFFEPVTDQHVETFLLTKEINFDLAVYESKYKDHPERIKRYILYARWYMFLFFVSFYDARSPGNIMAQAINYDLFFKQIYAVEEFQDVHRHWGQWYPEFFKQIEQRVTEHKT